MNRVVYTMDEAKRLAAVLEVAAQSSPDPRGESSIDKGYRRYMDDTRARVAGGLAVRLAAAVSQAMVAGRNEVEIELTGAQREFVGVLLEAAIK